MSCPSFLLRTARRLATIIGLLSLAMALGGCSAIKLGYATLPELSYWWIDGYLDFEDAQRQRVREDIARIHAWHRATELPKLMPLLQQAERLAPGDVTPEQACAFEAPVRERLAALRERLEPALVTNAITLTPRQLRHLERKYAQKNREYTKDWIELAPAERSDKRLKELVERAEGVYGRLDDAQLAVMARQLEGSPWNPATVLDERRRRQQDTLAVLRRLTGQPAVSLQDARVATHELVDRYFTSPDPAYRAYIEAIRRDTCGLASALHNSMPAEKRDFAVRRLRAWQRDLGELAARQ
jgi:hypothetical protein